MSIEESLQEIKSKEQDLIKFLEAHDSHKWKLKEVRELIENAPKNFYRASALLLREADYIIKARGMGYGLHEYYVTLADSYLKHAEKVACSTSC